MGFTYRSKLSGGAASSSISSGVVEANHTIRAIPAATITITGATNATPIIVTAVAHGLVTGDAISITGITGNTNANGYFKITRLSADTFSLQNYSTGADIAGNGAYGGAPVAVTGIVQAQRVLVGDGTAAAPSLAYANAAGYGLFSGATTHSLIWTGGGYGRVKFGTTGASAIVIETSSALGWTSLGEVTDTAGSDTFLTRGGAAATLQLGAANVTGAVAPVAQTLTVQSVGTTATADLAGADWTHKGSLGKGTAASGKHIFTVGTPQNTTVAHVPSTVLTLQDTGTAGTAAPQALFADGTLAKPSIAFSDPAYGFYKSGTSIFSTANLSSAGNISAAAAGTILWTGRASLTSPAAAVTQLGLADAATPVAQTLQAQGSRGGTDTDVAGANLTIRPGAGTGAATPPSLMFQIPAAVGSGTTAQTQFTRLTISSTSINSALPFTGDSTDTRDLGLVSNAWRNLYLSRATLGSKTKTFTNNTKTAFVTIAVPSSTVATGTIIYEIFVADATNTQAISGELKFSAAANSSGTVTAATTADAFTPLNPCTSGTLTNAITQTTGTNTLTIEFQPNTSLTSTTREIHYRINSPGTMAITPL